ncbi:NAD P-binding protein [Gloeophyllum trabeum ATCC 11539]|uniref:NAD P-binding protein n=1 Tax=Gloeophyllum trabeum (strain ATCC 11539 / FP-39264 / Madison 617) TaxID=670483 RepID=S7Q6Q5_GLOTA|nr:NAD P-binding protein [Gloeophyllum trabeum ATCC 11539]EPQ55731.1 NAD P-binding protein [Gloeophyllum trabeum ATCC 11539]
MDLGLQGVHVLVTGASGGIGLETTRVYLSLGATVTAHFNTQDATLKPLLAEHPKTLQALQANLASEPQVIKLIQVASSTDFGPVQVLVVNHGIWPAADEPVAEMSLERWNNTIAANLTSSFLIIREYLKVLKGASEVQKEKAAVVMVGSTAGKFGEAGHADYAVTKSGMMYGLTLSLKNEIVKIAPRGRVNTVAPGWVSTPMAEEALKDPNVSYRALATTPLKKIATPRDIANQIAIISSSVVSGHVTGQVVMVEGGMEGRLLNRPEDLL